MKVLIEYKSYTRDSKELENIEWDELKKSVNEVRMFIENINKFYDYDIEEESPSISNEEFRTGGWVGQYPEIGITVKPERIDEYEYEEIKREIINWIRILGAPFFTSKLPFLGSAFLHEDALYATYSRILISYTETLSPQYLTRGITFKENIGKQVRGKIYWKNTLRMLPQGVISTKYTRFRLDILPNLLLTIFHMTLAEKIGDISEAINLYKNLRNYHLDFISSEIPAELLVKSLETEFTSPHVIEKTRGESYGERENIVDLWEAFLYKNTSLTEISKFFDSALKPMSKIYELWCLKKLLDLFNIGLEDTRPLFENDRCIEGIVFSGQKLKLCYNKALDTYSHIIKKQLEINPGKPDFTLISKDNILYILDAKYKKKIDLGDIQRFMSYLLDYMYPQKMRGAILYLGEREKTISYNGFEIHLIPLRPNKKPIDKLKEYVDNVISK